LIRLGRTGRAGRQLSEVKANELTKSTLGSMWPSSRESRKRKLPTVFSCDGLIQPRVPPTPFRSAEDGLTDPCDRRQRKYYVVRKSVLDKYADTPSRLLCRRITCREHKLFHKFSPYNENFQLHAQTDPACFALALSLSTPIGAAQQVKIAGQDFNECLSALDSSMLEDPALRCS